MNDDGENETTQDEQETTETPAPDTPQDDVSGETPETPDEQADVDKVAQLSTRVDALESAVQELRTMMSSPSDAIDEIGDDTDGYGSDSEIEPEPEDITVDDLFRTK